MMEKSTRAAPVAGLAHRDRIVAEDVTMLRSDVFGDGVVTQAEAEALLALDADRADKCPEWDVFLVEAVTDYVVRQEKPYGYISAQNAAWLISVVADDGIVHSPTHLELLVRVIETAEKSPDGLSAFALNQVAYAAVEGRGPLANGRTLQPGVIGEAEVELLRRILYAFGGSGNVGITRAEAEVLFDINDRTSEALNHPAWNDLFVKAVASSILCASGYAPPSREEALRRDAFFDKAEPDLAGFFARMVNGGLRAVVDAYVWPSSVESGWASRNRAAAAKARTAAAVDEGEARWLAERIGRDGKLHESEAALLSFIGREAPSIHAELEPLLARAG